VVGARLTIQHMTANWQRSIATRDETVIRLLGLVECCRWFGNNAGPAQQRRKFLSRFPELQHFGLSGDCASAVLPVGAPLLARVTES